MVWNLKKLKFQTDKNKFSLENKESKSIFEKNIKEVTVPDKAFFDSGWIASEIVSCEGAYTQEFEKMMPQKAKFDYSELINFTPNMLPFLKYRLFFRTGNGSEEEKIYETEQELITVGQFNFSSLREVNYQICEWQGITSMSGSWSGWGGWINEPTPLPAITPGYPAQEYPQPESAYTRSNYWVNVRVTSIGMGLGPFLLNPEGTMVRTSVVPEVWTPYLEWQQSVFDTYGVSSYSIEAGNAWGYGFNYDYIFPIPLNTEIPYTFPGGTTDNTETHSTPTYQSQYWERQSITQFQGLVSTYGSYNKALSIVTDYYPELIVTPSDEGPPYYSYEIIEEERVVTGNKFFTIKKVNDEQFRININGHVLLLSKATKETDFSKEIAPTYEPEGDKVYTRLILYFQPNINPLENKSYEI